MKIDSNIALTILGNIENRAKENKDTKRDVKLFMRTIDGTFSQLDRVTSFYRRVCIVEPLPNLPQHGASEPKNR